MRKFLEKEVRKCCGKNGKQIINYVKKKLSNEIFAFLREILVLWKPE